MNDLNNAQKRRLTRFAAIGCALLVGAPACSGIADFGDETFELGTCNLVTNSPCTTTEMCVDVTAPHCAQAGKGAVGSPCTEDSDCVVSAVCAGSGERSCRQRCDVTADNCLGGDVCVTGLAPGVSTPYHFGYCSPCNPVTSEPCPPPQTCYMTPSPFCGAFGTSEVGETCTKASDCVRDAACIQISGAQSCLRKCDASLGHPQGQCAASETCYALKGSDAVPYPNHGGVCRPK